MNISDGAKSLYEFLPQICWMTEKNLAKAIGTRTTNIKSYKSELEDAGLIKITLHQNGKRSNPKHEITKYSKPKRSPICKHIRRSFCFGEWRRLGRNELIECYLKSDWNILPFDARSKRPMKGISMKEWGRLAAAEKMDFFFDHPNLNVGLVICRHLMVIDVDSKSNSWIYHEDFENTLTVSTQRGFHFYFRNDETVTTTSKVIPEIDTRCRNSFVVLPPSTHPSGGLYEWETVSVPRPLPVEFRRRWRQLDFETRKRSGDFILPSVIEQGARNDTLWRHGRSLRAKGKNNFEIEAELADLNRNNCAPPLPSAELKKLMDNVFYRSDKTTFRKAATV